MRPKSRAALTAAAEVGEQNDAARNWQIVAQAALKEQFRLEAGADMKPTRALKELAVISVRPGLGGGTSLSMQRRAHDARFATRYFVGYGLDVGGGDDSLSNFVELFPLITQMETFDKEQGDAQILNGVFGEDNYDFVYSSHCLEHMLDPYEALRNWIRVCKPGGHLVISVPDEDLYEQGRWPSTFNPDHKWSFTIHKHGSWSPKSINVVDLISPYLVQPLSIQTIDHAYRYRLPRFDQTSTPLCECSIEFILRKL